MNAAAERLSSNLTGQVVITGLGGVCSLGNSIPEISRGLMSGASGVKEITGFDASGFGRLAAQVKNPPSIKTDIHPQLAKSMGKHLSLLIASMKEALNNAGISSETFDPQDIGFFAGMGMVDYHVEDLLPAVLKSLNQDGGLDYDRFFSAGYQEIYPLWPLGMLNNVAFCQAAIHFDLRGENSVFSPHGDAGILAVAEAVKVLEEGKAKAALAGGVSEEISPLSLGRAVLTGLLRSPDAKNFLGECGAMLVLEPLSSALARGAGILGRIAGFGFSCGRDEKGDFASRQAISSAIKGALSDAECEPGQIDLIMLGSSHQNEFKAVREIFGMDVERPIIVATSKSLGEMLAAGPILNTAIALNISDPAALPHSLPSPFLSPQSSVLSPQSFRLLVNAISHEGRCASMIIEKTAGEAT